jgi:ABC-type nitrate/sulfonate/bicarbonate transport system permease component
MDEHAAAARPTAEDVVPEKPSKKRWRVHPLQIAGVVTFLGAWEIAAHYVLSINPKQANTILPSIEYVLGHSLPELATFYGVGMGGQYAGATSDYWRAFLVIANHSGITIARLLTGTILGMILGIGIGLILSLNKHVRAVIEPVVLVVRTIPILALIPLFIVWFGGAEIGNILYIGFAVFAMVVINTV